MNGFRTDPQGSKKDRLKALEVALQNSQMANRMSQMLVQQLMTSIKNISEDVSRAMSSLNEMQYKVLALQEASGLDMTLLNDIANKRRLKDFEEASDNEDKANNLTVGTVIDKDSIVILTTTTEAPDRGIFRSRIKLSESGVPDLISALEGREVGAKAIVKLNDVEHTVEVLGIRQPAAAVQAEPISQ